MRTFQGHERGSHPLDSPGSQDITVDVALDQIQMNAPADVVESQSQFLTRFGIDDLVDEGRRTWEANSHAPGLSEIRGRSRIREAEALLEGRGLGGFTVLQWIVARKSGEANETGR
jgi:SAM-dependent MidA family methyltransferase